MTLYQIITLDRAGAALARGPEMTALQSQLLTAARMSDRLHG